MQNKPFTHLRHILVALLLATVLLGPSTARAAEGFDINFTNVSIEDLIKTYAKWMGKNFLLTDKLKSGPITVYSERKVSKDEAWRVFEAVLRANGYTIVPGQEVNRIVPVAEAVSDLVPTYSTDGLVYGRNSYSYVTRLFPLEHVAASEVKPVIGKFLSKGADVMDYSPTNLLIITESSAHINRVIKILKELDVPSTEEMMEVLDVIYAEATEIAQIIESVLGAGAAGGAAATARRRGPPTPAAATAAAGVSSNARLIPVERTNQIIVVGSKKDIESVKKLLVLLDVDVEGTSSSEENIFVHYLQYADATEMASTLSSLITGAAQPTDDKSGRQLGGSSLQQNSAARQAQTLQQATQQARGGAGASPGGAESLTAARFESDIRVVADTATNSLLITATRRDYETLKKVIDKLDIPRRQVFIEAAILEVTVTDSSSLGFSFFGAGSFNNGDGIIFGQQNLGNPPSPLAATGTDAATSLGGLGGLTAGVIGPSEGVDFDGDGTDDLTVPTYGGILSAAKTDSSVNVLSTPTVLTSDNEQAQIIVANNVPIPTGQTVGTSGVTTSTISREDIGITLRITPQINEGDTLRLEIFVEISNVATGSFGIDVTQSGIVTTVRSAETVVSVKDRQPVVIGGLIQDSDNLRENKVPVLGDIPLLGALFRSRETVLDKQNLVILLTPHVIRDHFDATRVMALEVERRKPILETEVLRKWLDEKNAMAAQESFKRPPEEDRLPDELEADQLLITPDGVQTPLDYNQGKPKEPGETGAPDKESGEPLGTLRGIRRAGEEEGAAGYDAVPEAEGAAAETAPPPPEPGPERIDPEEIRRQILEERERRKREREEATQE